MFTTLGSATLLDILLALEISNVMVGFVVAMCLMGQERHWHDSEAAARSIMVKKDVVLLDD